MVTQVAGPEVQETQQPDPPIGLGFNLFFFFTVETQTLIRLDGPHFRPPNLSLTNCPVPNRDPASAPS
jgi:hypothetical protein